MQLFFMGMFLFIIIAPFIYFLYIFHNVSKILKIIISMMTFVSLLTILIKLFIKPYSDFFFIITLIVQFYIITIFVIFILSMIYHLVTHLLHKSISYKVIISFSVLSILFTSISYFTHFHKTVKNYEVTIHKESPLDSLRIATISDIHLGTGTYIYDLNHLVNELNTTSYDIVCLVGDIFDEATPPDMIEDAFKSLSQIQTTYGIYAINGNHEHYAHFLNQELYDKYNIHYLVDNYVCIDHLFNIVGREDVIAHNKTTTDKLFYNMDTSLPTIVLDHNPKRYQEIDDTADLQLSGHTHGGQLFPMTIATSLFYDDSYGKFEKNNFSLIVTSGYGSWGFPIRFMTNCEYLDIKIAFTKK